MGKADVKGGSISFCILKNVTKRLKKKKKNKKFARRDAKWPLKGFVAQSENRTDTEVTVSKIKERQAICINNM